MNSVVAYRNREVVIEPRVMGCGYCGGRVDEMSRRLGNIESDVAELKADVRAISAIIPHLATRAEIAELRTEIASMETTIIKWIIATMLATGGLAFSFAKFVH